MATIVKGTTFTTTVTAGGMHTLVESATISAISRTSMRITEASLGTRSAAPPPGAGNREVWQSSNGNGIGTYDATNAFWVPGLTQMLRYKLPSSSASVTAGTVLVAAQGVGDALTDVVAATCPTGSGNQALGVALSSVLPGEYGLMAIRGPTRVKTEGGGVVAGAGVQVSGTTAGVVQGLTVNSVGFSIIGVALEDESGGFAWISLRR